MSRVRKILFCIVLGLLAAMFALSAYFAIGIQISGGELGQWGWLDNDSTRRVHRKVDDGLRPTVGGHGEVCHAEAGHSQRKRAHEAIAVPAHGGDCGRPSDPVVQLDARRECFGL